ncbi:MAG: PBECR4 domain-containing protein [Clostridiaceae bacterium]|nr:PBECR4 domain-containing protein [Clostridiaceae bacterium]
MSKKQDRIDIAEKIKTAAILYKQNLVGKRFMYVFDERYIEVIFKTENFKHLTGVDTNLSAKQFYKYAVKGQLAASQIWFGPKHPFSLCTRKVQHIGDVATMAGSECFMLEEIKTDTMSYKFGTTDLEFSLCLNKETDQNGDEKGDCYVVQSLRDENCFSKSNEAYVVTHIFSRQNDGKKYTEALFIDDSSSIESLPEKIKTKISDKLLPAGQD